MIDKQSSTPKWRVSLTGDGTDLRIIRDYLIFSLVLEDYNSNPIGFFSDEAFDDLLEFADVRDQAVKTTELWNAALTLIDPNYKGLKTGEYIQRLGENGEVESTNAFIQPSSATLRLYASPVRVTYNSSTQDIRSYPERVIDLMRKCSEFDSAVRIFSTGQHDFKLLYIVMEYIRDGVGRPAKGMMPWLGLKAKNWASGEALLRFRHTANDLHRHKRTPSSADMSIGEARTLVAGLLECWCNELMPI